MKSESPNKFYTIEGELKSFQRGKSLGARCHKSSILIPNDNPAPGAYDPTQVQSTKGIVNLKADRVYLFSYLVLLFLNNQNIFLDQELMKTLVEKIFHKDQQKELGLLKARDL